MACLILPVLLALLLGCVNPPPAPPPVYLIVVDTLRVDALGCYGGKRPTPNFDRFAASSVVFENCLAPASWTVPSVASIWTGLYPFHHGTTKAATDNGGNVVSQESLSTGYTTLGEVFKQAGYRAYGISANGHIAEAYGFAQGFDVFVGHSFKSKEQVAASWAGLFPRLTAERRFGQPTFVMFFFFDPHHPYIPQEPYITEYCPDWTERAKGLLDRDMVELVNGGYFKKHPDQIEVARALYDSRVASLDAYFETLFRDLPDFDRAWVIVVADHGESFGERGQMLHGNNLYQPEAHVPLIIKLPRNQLAGKRIAAPVSLVDVLPTLAAIIQAPQPPKMDGVSLLPALADQPLPARPLFMQIDVPWARQRAMLLWPFKIVRTRHEPAEVYDLSHDPTESRDLRREKLAEMDHWESELDLGTRINIRFPPRVINSDMTEEMRQKLRSLGYLH